MIANAKLKNFRWKYTSLIVLAWTLPPFIGLYYLVYIRLFSNQQLEDIILSPLLGSFTIGSVLISLLYFSLFSRPMTRYLKVPNVINADLANEKLWRFSFHFWGVFLTYMIVTPILVMVSAVLYADFFPQISDWFKICLVAIVISIIVGLPIFFLILDLFGKTFGELIVDRAHVTIRVKVFLIGALTPLLINTMLIQYYWTKTEFFTWETFMVWLSLELLAIIGSFVFVHSFTQSLDPLKKILTRPTKIGEIATAELLPQSTDELGVLISGYKRLLTDLHVQNELLLLSNRVLRDVGKDHNAAKIYLNIVTLCKESITGDKIFLILHDEKNDELVGVAQTGEGYREIGHFRLSLNEISLAAEVYTQGKTSVVSDVSKDVRLNTQITKKYHVRSAIATPLMVEKNIIGVLMSTNKEIRGEYTKQDIQLIEGFAREAAIAIHTQILIDFRLEAEKALKESEIRYRRMIETSNEGVWMVNENNQVTFVNKRMSEILGYDSCEMIGKQWRNYVDDEMAEVIKSTSIELLKGISIQKDFRFIKNDGSELWTLMNASPIFQEENKFIGALAMFTDITERKKAEDQIQRMAYHDSLTGLPNRALFMDRLQQALFRMERHGGKGAVMFLDLDRFKTINDSLGHPTGDAILIETANRLSESIRSEDTVARLGGDEFVILISEDEKAINEESAELKRLAEKLRAELAKPFYVNSLELHITVSIGIVTFPQHGENSTDIIREADTAMYRAKTLGRNHVQFYLPDMADAAHERLLLENQLRNALRLNEFVIQLQPQLCIKSHKIVAVEALLRWNNATTGLVSPDTFLDLLDETGLINEVGVWVLRQSIQELLALRAEKNIALQDLRLSVNVSPRQFQQDNFVETITDILEESKLPPDTLELEITEDILIMDMNDTINKMHSLKKLGVTFAIDDFGTGYSSLTYLKQLPVDILKIDRSFVSDLSNNKSDRAIVETIIAMSEHLGLEVVAEGVETKDQFEFLQEQGCQYYQGYYFAEPLGTGELIEIAYAE